MRRECFSRVSASQFPTERRRDDADAAQDVQAFSVSRRRLFNGDRQRTDGHTVQRQQ